MTCKSIYQCGSATNDPTEILSESKKKLDDKLRGSISSYLTIENDVWKPVRIQRTIRLQSKGYSPRSPVPMPGKVFKIDLCPMIGRGRALKFRVLIRENGITYQQQVVAAFSLS